MGKIANSTTIVAACAFAGLAIGVANADQNSANANSGSSSNSGSVAGAGASAGANSGGNAMDTNVNFNSQTPSHLRVTSVPDVVAAAPQPTATCLRTAASSAGLMGVGLGHVGTEPDGHCHGLEDVRVSTAVLAQFSPQDQAAIRRMNMETIQTLHELTMGELRSEARNEGIRLSSDASSSPAVAQNDSPGQPTAQAAPPAAPASASAPAAAGNGPVDLSAHPTQTASDAPVSIDAPGAQAALAIQARTTETSQNVPS